MNLINTVQAGVITDAPSISNVGMNILNFLLSVLGIFAIIALVLSGIMYFMIQDDKKKLRTAKNAIKYSILGMVIALGGMVVVKMIGQFF